MTRLKTDLVVHVDFWKPSTPKILGIFELPHSKLVLLYTARENLDTREGQKIVHL